MNEKDIKDAIKQRIADKIQNACDGENIADAIMGNEQNQDFIDTNEQDKVQDMQNEAQTEKDVKDEKEDKETTNREIGKFKNPKSCREFTVCSKKSLPRNRKGLKNSKTQSRRRLKRKRIGRWRWISSLKEPRPQNLLRRISQEFSSTIPTSDKTKTVWTSRS